MVAVLVALSGGGDHDRRHGGRHNQFKDRGKDQGKDHGMLGLERIGVQSRLIVLMLLVSLGSIAVIGWIGYRSARAAITNAVQNQLQSVRHSKTSGLMAMLGALRDQVISLSDGKLATEAMEAFRDAYRGVGDRKLTAEQEEELEKYYTSVFMRRLRARLGGSQEAGQYVPSQAGQRYLQFHYMVHPQADQAAAKAGAEATTSADAPATADDSPFARVHAALHERFGRVASLFGFEDMLLIDDDSLEVVYTLCKRPDFATSLRDGPYASTKLAAAVDAISRERDRDAFKVVDTENYRPHDGVPVGFVVSPIFDGPDMVGILALEFPMDRIIQLLSGNFQWEREGMGKTGECYVVGPDFTMRSRSRFMVEDSKAFLQTLRSSPLPRAVVEQIERQGNVIGQLPVRTQAVEQALLGREGLAMINDYRGVPVLSSYGPFDLDSLRWAVVAEMDADEAYGPITDYARKALLAATALALTTTLLALASSWLLMRPLRQLTDAARSIGAGATDVRVDLHSRDEFGELARTFNDMSASLTTQRKELERKAAENQELLLNIMPAAAVEQRRSGDEHATTRFADVTVLVAEFGGLAGLGAARQAGGASPGSPDPSGHDTVALARMADLVAACDDAAERSGVEKIRAVGGKYLAVCGMSVHRPDHAARAVVFAKELLKTVAAFNLEHGTSLVVSVGIDSGPIVGGVVGRQKFRYDLWGDTLALASRLAVAGNSAGNAAEGRRATSVIHVTQPVHERLSDLYAFVGPADVAAAGQETVRAWRLEA
jgi:HAMP domain-containing protein